MIQRKAAMHCREVNVIKKGCNITTHISKGQTVFTFEQNASC